MHSIEKKRKGKGIQIAQIKSGVNNPTERHESISKTLVLRYSTSINQVEIEFKFDKCSINFSVLKISSRFRGSVVELFTSYLICIYCLFSLHSSKSESTLSLIFIAPLSFARYLYGDNIGVIFFKSIFILLLS